MLDLTQRWPLGLHRRNWPLYGLGFVALLAAVVPFDIWASRGAIGWSDGWRYPFFLVTDYGLSDWVLIPSLVSMLVALAATMMLRGRLRCAARELALVSAFIFLGVGAPGLLANLLKRLIGRGRPELFDRLGAFDFQMLINDSAHQSFPSGHTTTAMATAMVAGFLLPRLFKPLLAVGLIVGFSRVPVGMHYPTDVVGGVACGTLGAFAVRNWFASRRWLFCPKADGTIVRRPLVAVRRLFSGGRRSAAAPQPSRL